MNDLLRRNIRKKRRALSSAKQRSAKYGLTDVLYRTINLGKPDRLAFYIANDGEIDPSRLIINSLKQNKSCYLPVLHPLQQKRLYFVRYLRSTSLSNNRFDIPEPSLVISKITPPWALDIIFLPLVAFDRRGSRLGMGSGYYDRTLARCHGASSCKPLLVGLAHSFQEVNHLQTSAWDIPMDMIATEKELIIVDPSRTRGGATK
jgi:5-formyltetrahydrofolate cyclo-ligase